MSLIQCTECGHMVSDRAKACPNCGCPVERSQVCEECGATIPIGAHFCNKCGCPAQQPYTAKYQEYYYKKAPKKSKWWIWALVTLLVCALAGGGYYLYTKKNEANNNGQENTLLTDRALIDGPTNNLSSEESKNDAEETESKGNWKYKTEKDPMTDEISHIAGCRSNETQYIYGARTHLDLLLMKFGDNAIFVLLGIQRGVLRQDKLPMAYVRFDDGEIETYSVMANGAREHHIMDVDKFISHVKNSKKCAIKVEAQDGGTATFTFNVEGLIWNY